MFRLPCPAGAALLAAVLPLSALAQNAAKPEQILVSAKQISRAGMSAAQIRSLREQRQLTPLLTVRAQAAGTILDMPLAAGQQVEAGIVIADITLNFEDVTDVYWARQQVSERLASVMEDFPESVSGDMPRSPPRWATCSCSPSKGRCR